MSAIHVRGVPPETVARLKQRAAAHGRSLEAELRHVLDDAAQAPIARRPRPIVWPTRDSGRHESLDRHDLYPDDDD